MTTLKLISKLEKEYNKLSKKCEKLYIFLGSDKFTQLDPVMQKLLAKQYKHMIDYASCLVNRISLLKYKKQEV